MRQKEFVHNFLPNQLNELTQIETVKITKFMTREVVETCLLEQTCSVKNCYWVRVMDVNRSVYFAEL